MLIHDAEIAGRRVALRSRDGLIVELANGLRAEKGELEIDARGGALLPGLHDHHLHLFSLAAQFDSIPCGPPRVDDRADLQRILRRAEPISGWLRGTGYHESVSGALDRNSLDAFRHDCPMRIQHRSGSMWFLNSRAIEALGLDHGPGPSGVERDAAGRATGRLFRADEWLRQKLPASSAPDLSAVGSFLARCGVTGVTDATPTNGAAEAKLFARAQASGALPQRLRLMGDLSLSAVAGGEGLEIGEHKIMLDECVLPDFDELVLSIDAAHESKRCVAIHTVTRSEIHFALAAIEAADRRSGDRLEHASVAPLETLALARRLGLRIVTQPNFVSERGDAYRRDVEARDLSCLYRVRSWLDAGVSIGAGTDAPFGDPDPWRAIRAAVTRRTRSGDILGKDEIVTPEMAVGLFMKGFLNVESSERPIDGPTVGQPADLCLLNAPWAEARRDLSSETVVATFCAGQIVWSA